MLHSQESKLKRLLNSHSRYKYDGLLIHQDYDDNGALEVVEANGVRSLHFGSSPRQSSMLLSAPNQLHLEYAKTMATWMLFKETLNDDVLLIGLGGGSLAKHLWHQFPDCQVNVIEYRKSVVKIARSHFGLPLDTRLKVVVDDGAEYVRKRLDNERELYSLIMVDAFDAMGMAHAICNWSFFENCQKLLKKDGILVINCWGGVNRPQFQKIALWLGKLFNWKLLFVPVQGRGNIIGLAFNEKTPTYALKHLRTRAIVLEQLYEMEFTRFLRDLVKHNSSVLQNIIHK
ncbi:MAG: spermine synthase [Methylococcales bacterium]|nr:spermine synthase [Methylococcales bacterium]